MFRWIKRLGLGVIGLIALLAAALAFGPRDEVARHGPASQVEDAEAVLAAHEAAFDDITPGAEGRIVWAGTPGDRTPLVVLYLHGFSATAEELRPVPDRVAEALGANLVFARLRGHGRDGAALAVARAGEWADDAAFYLQLARAVGDQVLILGTSTGATLAAYAMTEPDMAEDVIGVAMISPNFRVVDPAGVLMELGFARSYVPLLVGPERSFEPYNADQARYWTTRYGSPVLASLGALMRETRGRDYGDVTVPLLAMFCVRDQVVSPDATREFVRGWGGAVTVLPQDPPTEGMDPSCHVIGGDILSPAMTGPMTDAIVDWAADFTD
ncbi:alpha/beta hydrolase [Nioella nitratireducens]|uniref:alpha/beta hydrolase n=1 Tax=Nioella nitratireducens TaxID=1287720 RepID=UPI0009FE16AF|nr:alpha/beta hydrolase [Nioella nitratireducens]